MNNLLRWIFPTLKSANCKWASGSQQFPTSLTFKAFSVFFVYYMVW